MLVICVQSFLLHTSDTCRPEAPKWNNEQFNEWKREMSVDVILAKRAETPTKK